jgi:hypothetical protein
MKTTARRGPPRAGAKEAVYNSQLAIDKANANGDARPCRLSIVHCTLMSRVSALALVVVALSACSTAEEPIVARFFAASALRDTTALSDFSLVVFEPTIDGIVQRFTIDSVSPEQRRSLSRLAFPAVAPLLRLSADDSSIRADDPAAADGEIVTKQLAISAQVMLPNGQTVRRPLVVTMQRAVLAGGQRVGQWVITGMKAPSDSSR